jgi:hypothetical protein
MKVKKSLSIEKDFIDEVFVIANRLTKERGVYLSTSEMLEQMARLGMLAMKASEFKDLENIEERILNGFKKG